MSSCHSIQECDDLFTGVKLSIRSFCFIIKQMALYAEISFDTFGKELGIIRFVLAVL